MYPAIQAGQATEANLALAKPWSHVGSNCLSLADMSPSATFIAASQASLRPWLSS
ncbi:hypothetical protein SALBM135S_04118 [Streptomyces alboniger]